MEENKMILTIEEKQAVERYQGEIKDAMAALGSVRRQALRSEHSLLQRIDNLENEFMNHLRALAKNRGMPDDEDWIFDPNTFSFVKKTG
jgi:hypothetical protein